MQRALTMAMTLSTGAAAAALHAAPPAQLQPLAFLLGEWTGAGSGRPGDGTGRSVFAPSLQGRVILRTSDAEYPASAKGPASRHDDLMIISVAADGAVRADYFDNEGHVIRYAVRTPAPGEAVFVSDPVAGAPRFRLSYKLRPDGVLAGAFAIAPPAQPEAFAQYLAWESRKAVDGGK